MSYFLCVLKASYVFPAEFLYADYVRNSVGRPSSFSHVKSSGFSVGKEAGAEISVQFPDLMLI